MENQIQRPGLWSRLGAMVVLAFMGNLCVAAHRDGSDKIELPPMIVEGAVDGVPWQYGRNKEVEVLTLCGKDLTAEVIAAKTRSRLYLPGDFQHLGYRPLRFVFFDQAVALGSPPPSRSILLTEGQFGEGWGVVTNMINNPAGITAANMFGVSSWPELHAGFAVYYFDNCRPLAPSWLKEGLLGKQGALSSLAGYDNSMRMVRLGAFAWDQEKEVKAMLNKVNELHGLYPLAELFESPPPADPQIRRWWELQAALFCRWQIYSPEGQRNGGNGFWQWARLARKGPVDEQSFRACIGYDYAGAETRMRKYLSRVIGAPEDVPIRLYPLADELEFRPATDLEVARLLGEFQWQEAKRQRAEGRAEQAERYEAAARRTYTRGLKRTGGEAALHAGLGLLEYESGDLAAARPHLERAMAGKGAETPALLALARLRLAEVRVSADGEGRLNADQIGFVLTPLFAARAMVPVEAEMYRLIGEAWSLSAFVPEARHLNVLLEGVGNFPHDLELAHQVAELHARFGHREIARAVAQRAEKLSGRGPQRARFETLLAGLARP